MDENTRILCNNLRKMNSNEAASWLIKTYRVGSFHNVDVFLLIQSRTWKRSDQLILARYYFQKIPFASSAPYSVFASFMSIKSLVTVIREFLPKTILGIDLLNYHLKPILYKAIKTTNDSEIVDSFFRDLESARHSLILLSASSPEPT